MIKKFWRLIRIWGWSGSKKSDGETETGSIVSSGGWYQRKKNQKYRVRSKKEGKGRKEGKGENKETIELKGLHLANWTCINGPTTNRTTPLQIAQHSWTLLFLSNNITKKSMTNFSKFIFYAIFDLDLDPHAIGSFLSVNKARTQFVILVEAPHFFHNLRKI